MSLLLSARSEPRGRFGNDWPTTDAEGASGMTGSRGLPRRGARDDRGTTKEFRRDTAVTAVAPGASQRLRSGMDSRRRQAGGCAWKGVFCPPHLGWSVGRTRAQQLLRWATPFGHNRHGPKGGMTALPLSVEGAGSQSNAMSPGPTPTSVPSGISIHPTV